MNEQPRPLSGTTQAAEGLPRRRWSVVEIEAMVARGIILEDERFELIGGEVVPMSPKGARHEGVKAALQENWFPRIVGTPISLITETTLYVSDEPDFLFWPRTIAPKDVTAASALLIVEVADTSLDYDLGTKALAYARLGLREFWVINARTLETRVHLRPTSSVYEEVRDHPADARLTPHAMPDLTITLGELTLD